MRRLIIQLFLCIYTITAAECAVDISMIVIDFKYNDQDGIKVCEVQPLRISALKGYYHTHQEDPDYIKNYIGEWFKGFNMPKWAENRRLGDSKLKQIYYDIFKMVQNPNQLIMSNKEFLEHKNVIPSDPNDIRSYTGMVYFTSRSLAYTEPYRSSFPSIIFIDDSFHPLNGDKLKVNELFSVDKELDKYRPKWGVYPKKYSSTLSDQILDDIGSDILVIKPRHAAKGYGVIIVNAKDLDDTLRFILNKSDKLKNDKDTSYSYWHKENGSDFIVEEFISSDPVNLDEELFDPTYRFIVILHYDRGQTHMEIIDGYAKLPQKGINEKGSLNMRYKSCGKVPYFSSIKNSDYPVIVDQLENCLHLFYSEMMSIKEAD